MAFPTICGVLLFAITALAASDPVAIRSLQVLDSSHIMYNGHVYTKMVSPSVQRRLFSQHEPPAETGQHNETNPEDHVNGSAAEHLEELECETEHQLLPQDGAEFWITVGLTMMCIFGAATAAGLTLGLLSIDKLQLEILSSPDAVDWSDPGQWGSTEKEEAEEMAIHQTHARRIYPIVEPHSESNQDSCWRHEPQHLLMVTLLLMNSLANEALPLFLDKLMPSPIVAVLVSVSVVLIVGEIVPTALFTGEYQLRLAATMIPVVYFFKTLLVPITWPIAWFLDHTLGTEAQARFNRTELKTLIKIHGQDSLKRSMSPVGEHNEVSTDEIEQLNNALVADEVHMVKGVLELREQKAKDHMTLLKDVHMISSDAELDEAELAKLIGCGHSRLPVFSGEHHNIKGILLVKRLICVNPEDRRPVSTMHDVWREPLIVPADIDLQSLLNVFQKTKQHVAVVCRDLETGDRCRALIHAKEDLDRGDVLGIISLEDVIENLIQEEIYDETTDPDSVKVKLAEAFTLQRRLPALRKLVAKERRLLRIDQQAVTHLRHSMRYSSGKEEQEPATPTGHSTMDAPMEDGYISVEMK